MHVQRLRTISWSSTVTALLLSLAVMGPPPVEASSFENLDISVSPAWPTTSDPLVVTVTGVGSCPLLSDPIFDEYMVEFILSSGCPISPPASEFTLYTVLEPLPTGTWTIRVTSEGVVGDHVNFIVADYGLEITPSPASSGDQLTARLTGFGVCAILEDVTIVPGQIHFSVFQLFGLCDPPIVGPFEFEVPLGRVPPGDYAVHYFLSLYPNDVLVASTNLQVSSIGACQPGENVLCLGGGRFSVEADWSTTSGEGGLATAVEESFDTGLFWFFDQRNIELVVKVLDACDTEFESFWVFAGGLTDVGVRLTVTDTETGTTAIYNNPIGQRFETIADTAAFATCP